MITILHEMECKLGRLPYAYEVIEHTGMVSKTVMLKLGKLDFYPKELLISDKEKIVVDMWNSNKSFQEISEAIGSKVNYTQAIVIRLSERGVLVYNKRAKKKKEDNFNGKKKELFELKPLPTRRMWQRDPASGMIGGIL